MKTRLLIALNTLILLVGCKTPDGQSQLNQEPTSPSDKVVTLDYENKTFEGAASGSFYSNPTLDGEGNERTTATKVSVDVTDGGTVSVWNTTDIRVAVSVLNAQGHNTGRSIDFPPSVLKGKAWKPAKRISDKHTYDKHVYFKKGTLVIKETVKISHLTVTQVITDTIEIKTDAKLSEMKAVSFRRTDSGWTTWKSSVSTTGALKATK